MKLIIDIDEKDFEIMKHNIEVDNPLCPINQKDMVIKIANGTPLDKIRAEIEEHRRKTRSIDSYDLIGDCLDIIDKFGGDDKCIT